MNDLQLAKEAARAGAKVIRRWFGGRVAPDYKAKDNPVTAADRESEDVILTLIREERPDDTILAEEGGTGAAGTRRWIVDPLDGTVNFMTGIPHVAVSVACYEDDEALVAVVLDALTEEEFSAARGEGACLDGAPIAVSRTEDLGAAVVATGFPYDHKRYAAEYGAPLIAVLAEVQGIRRTGSAALDFAWLAAGRFDAYWELGLAPWDLAGGALLVREAGGVVTDPFGSPTTPESPLVVATNGHIHEQLRSIIAAHMPPHLS